jgi:hypothetical protein
VSLALLFWIIFIVAVVFGGYGAANPAWPGWRFAWWVPVVLIAILGFAVFGFHVTR